MLSFVYYKVHVTCIDTLERKLLSENSSLLSVASRLRGFVTDRNSGRGGVTDSTTQWREKFTINSESSAVFLVHERQRLCHVRTHNCTGGECYNNMSGKTK